MRNFYASRIMFSLYAKICVLLVAVVANINTHAQTTLETPVPSGIVYYSDNAPGVISLKSSRWPEVICRAPPMAL